MALGAFGSMTGPEVAGGYLFTFDTGEGLLPRGAGPPSLPVIPPGSGAPGLDTGSGLPSGGGLTKPSPGVPSGAPIGLGGGSLSLTGAGVLVPGLTLTGDALL